MTYRVHTIHTNYACTSLSPFSLIHLFVQHLQASPLGTIKSIFHFPFILVIFLRVCNSLLREGTIDNRLYSQM